MPRSSHWVPLIVELTSYNYAFDAFEPNRGINSNVWDLCNTRSTLNLINVPEKRNDEILCNFVYRPRYGNICNNSIVIFVEKKCVDGTIERPSNTESTHLSPTINNCARLSLITFFLLFAHAIVWGTCIPLQKFLYKKFQIIYLHYLFINLFLFVLIK